MQKQIERCEHKTFSDRISRLLDLSREYNFDFDLTKGDDVLNNFWDISDLFREELVYKLKNGKLAEFIQKGYDNMNNTTGYKQALLFDNQMQSVLKNYAKEQNIPQTKLIGLYDLAAKYEVLDSDIAEHSLIHSVDGKIVSTKPYNLKFRLVATLSAIIETGITLFTSDEKIPTIIQLIKILITLMDESSIKMTEDQAKVLIECHRLHASNVPVDEQHILESTNTSHKTINELCRLKCIEIIEGRIKLVEEIIIL